MINNVHIFYTRLRLVHKRGVLVPVLMGIRHLPVRLVIILNFVYQHPLVQKASVFYTRLGLVHTILYKDLLQSKTYRSPFLDQSRLLGATALPLQRKHASFSSACVFLSHNFSNNNENLPSARLPRGGATGPQRVAAGSFPTLSPATPSLGVGSHG